MERCRVKQTQAGFGIGAGIQRPRRLVATEAMAIGEGRILFVNEARIRQQVAAQVDCRCGCVYRPLEAIARQHRQPAGVIEVSVGQDNAVQRLRRDRQWLPVAQAQLLVALKQAAVDQNAALAGLDQELRTGDGSGRTEEADRQPGMPGISLFRSHC